jgi:dephospho-CoA kinase
MIKIGLTGGIGSGKSEAARVLAQLGARIVTADDLARDLVIPGSVVLDALVGEFGDEILSTDGRLDRTRLAEVAFASEDALARLNAATHPPLVNAIRATIERVEKAGESDVLVVEAALLAEWDILGLFDIVLVIDAPFKTRFDRLAGAGLSKDVAEARMRAQLPRERLLEAADVIIENDGSIEELGARIKQFWTEFVSGERSDT